MTFGKRTSLIASLVCLLIIAAAPALAEESPASGKADTFELDKFLRRKAHPLTVKLIEHAGAAGTNVPVTFGIGCGEGDYQVGKLCPVLAGKPLCSRHP